MKKSLFAIAAVTAFAGAAQAQSSVTVYGILDVGYIGTNARVSNSSNVNNGGQAKTTTNQFGSSAEQTSRLGFKGTEDLGGGSQAFFTTEFQLYPEQQQLNGNTVVGANSNGVGANTGGLLNRQTFVGLHKNGLGQFAVGLQYTPVFAAVAATDVGQTNNMAGNVIYAATSSGNSNDGASSNAMTVRTANTLTVASDKFSGFGANVMFTENNKNASQVDNTSGVATAGGNTNASGWGLGADYTYNKFFINAAYQSLKQLTTVGNVTPFVATVNTPAAWTQAQGNGATTVGGGAFNSTDNQTYVSATYDFGILKAYAGYINRKVTATADTGYYLKRQAEQIGVRSYITPTIEGWASAGLGRYTAFGNNTPTANFNGWQLGSNYYLSKRTNLYAIYGQTLTSNSAAGTVTTSGGYSNYAVGVRHTF